MPTPIRWPQPDVRLEHDLDTERLRLRRDGSQAVVCLAVATATPADRGVLRRPLKAIGGDRDPVDTKILEHVQRLGRSGRPVAAVSLAARRVRVGDTTLHVAYHNGLARRLGGGAATAGQDREGQQEQDGSPRGSHWAIVHRS